jgi:tripeptidyl-peptidase-1
VVLAEDPRSFIERDTALPVSKGWTKLESKTNNLPHRNLDVIFMLKQRNLDTLEETFWAVSNPQNPRYGQHMSLAQIADLVAPTQKSINEVLFFLKSNGVDNVYLTLSRDMLVAKMPTTTASRLFGIKYDHYRHTTGQTSECSLGPYSLPSSIAKHIDFVSGVVGLPYIEESKIPRGTPTEGDLIDPTVIRARYNISANLVGSHPNNSHAVAEFQAQYYAPSDLELFWKKFVDYAPFKAIDKVIGYNDPSEPSLEASLDVQYIMGVCPNVTTWFYSMKSFNFWTDLTTWASELNSEAVVPLVISVSYGVQEASEWPSETYMARLNAEFQKVGTRGVSIMFASGDSGANCNPGTESKCSCSLSPSFPAISQYVTSVGATRFLSGNSGPEGAVAAFLSGGGFAPFVFDQQPVGQSDAVSEYFKQDVKFPLSCSYNATGRATPDVSALGDIEFQVYQGGSITIVGGTSASSPTFSAVMTLLNDLRLKANKAPLGFLNPWIYQTFAAHSHAFFDVTVGSNAEEGCCGSGNLGGFDCAKGWDPVTGVGTPNYEVLSTLV